MRCAWRLLITRLSTANIEHFPKEWIRDVKFAHLSAKSRNRLALGAAGHRYLSYLKYLRPQDFLPGPGDAQVFIAGMRDWSKDKIWWDLHPITKLAVVITVTGSINKLLEDCLANSITSARLGELASSRILNHVPIAVPTHGHWKTFDLSLLPKLAESIF